MGKQVRAISKFTVTAAASVVGIGPFATLTKDLAGPILTAIIGNETASRLASRYGDLATNLSADFLKEFFDTLKSNSPEELQRIWILALRESLITARDRFRKEYGQRIFLSNIFNLPDDEEKFFTDTLAKIDQILKDKIDIELVFTDHPALNAIYSEDNSSGWIFLDRNLTNWSGGLGFPQELRERLSLELPSILSDHFSTLIANENYQQAFTKYQVLFTEKLYQGLNSLYSKIDVTNAGIDELNIKANKLVQLIEEKRHMLERADTETSTTYKQTNLFGIRQNLIKKWSQVTYNLNERFVQLKLLIDRGVEETQRWERRSLESIAEILKINEEDYPVMVILGAPGSGKSTILRRLELDYHRGQIGAEGNRLSFFVPLNRYKPGNIEQPVEPIDFLESMWGKDYDDTGITLRSLLKEGRVLLLLDAVNEIQHRSSEDYVQLIELWREFAIDQQKRGNRIIFSCRSLDYSQSLSGPEMRVPNVELQPLTVEKIREFLQAYHPLNHAKVFEEIRKTGTLEFYNNPYFLSLLCKQIGKDGEVPKGRASLFTGYVRAAIKREMDSDLFNNAGFLSKADRLKLTYNRWANPFQLPLAGDLPRRLSHLAYEMQQSGQQKENKQVSIGLDEALELIATERAAKILEAGVAITVLDQDIGADEVKYYHQLLQEYFAGRRLAEEPKPELVRVEWRASEVRPTLAETIASLANGDPLPPPGQTGWEETTLAALPMSKDPEGYVARLIEHNLPLAARCAVSPEVKIPDELKDRIRRALISQTQDMKADLRARIAAGEALGLIGDPRFERYQGNESECLLPPMVNIPGGEYPIGDDHSGFANERPAHKVLLNAFQIGVYPVTNAEYAKFMDAGGYENESWWDCSGALKWIREGGSGSQKQAFRDDRSRLQNEWTEEEIRSLSVQNRATEKQVEDYLWRRNSSDDEYERYLNNRFPSGILDRQPRYWEDITFNNPLQPVVGVCWYEAQAYCKWLSNLTGYPYRLLTEVEYEAAARGSEGRKYAYGNEFESERYNTFESHIRRPTPVGIFENQTKEGVFDLNGNVWTWTTTIYDQEKYGYPYKEFDGRENVQVEDVSLTNPIVVARVSRGGSWRNSAVRCHSAFRRRNAPGFRSGNLGFRLVRALHPSRILSSSD